MERIAFYTPRVLISINAYINYRETSLLLPCSYTLFKEHLIFRRKEFIGTRRGLLECREPPYPVEHSLQTNTTTRWNINSLESFVTSSGIKQYTHSINNLFKLFKHSPHCNVLSVICIYGVIKHTESVPLTDPLVVTACFIRFDLLYS